MSFLLRLKPWQLFSLTFGLPLLFSLCGNMALFMKPPQMPIFIGCFIASVALFTTGLFCWLWALGTQLPTLLPKSMLAASTKLKIGLVLPSFYIIAVLALFAAGVSKGFSISPAILLFILPLHMLSMAGIFYSLYFVAKTLKSVELQRPASLSDCLGEFFLLWFFPVGIWLIQPRINRLFAPSRAS
ncbi:hypothetical protein J0X19_09090 [Hymenobacter sp. BT186]|uniref:Uncharacterized protein n=1 Tax=Hymenobacter telluris TaxID=2816474 RepID=A0A939EVR1_9BACT|nr:hypothetical protein [Hymenobacter telluris]MBO0358096.1 hypothetical protein [Hymenobacter telluris]MBW3374123.1 hypothetical protein [Hymenobacter norwichensis]